MYKESEVDIEAIKKEVISLATELFKNSTNRKGTNCNSGRNAWCKNSVKQLNAHVASLYSLRDKLIELKKTL